MSSDVFERFHTHLEARDKSLHSIRAYLSDLRQFATWFVEHTGEPFTLETVTEYDVRDWRDHLAATMKPATVNRKLASLSALYRWAGETGQAERDPTRYVNGIKQQPVAPKAMSKQDLTRILRAARKGNKRDAALLEFLAATGLRASEVAGLTVGDVELNERSGWATVRGKGRKQRKVPIHARARRALNEYLEERDDPAGDEPLFLSQKGEAISSYAVWYTVKKYAALAEVEDVTPHTFRHTVATQLVRDPEVDLVTAATFLGHSRLDTTARYSQPSAEDLEKAANRLG
ncbi:MAG: tyrosine-type recombinase/integrase [Anaerolineae bacterium]|jgi:site-specific recombinase XerD